MEHSRPFRWTLTEERAGYEPIECDKLHYVTARYGARQIEARGIFVGAEVSRDVDWEYGDDDGGAGSIGKVLSCRQWQNETSYRSAVEVQWAVTKKYTLCRLGYKGKVDVKCVTSASGGYYYHDHVPLLGSPHKPPGPREFASGDHVKVELNEEAFTAAMKNGQAMDTIMMIGEVGVINTISDGKKATVKFDEQTEKTIDVSALIKPDIPRMWCRQVVRVIDDMAEVMKLQSGHGEWRDEMENILGKTGVVLGQNSKGDIAIRFEGRETDLLLNPRCIEPVTDEPVALKPGVGFRRDDSALEAEVRTLFEQDDSYVLFKAAHLGDATIIKEFLNKFSNEVNKKFENGRTALHLAALAGHLPVVKVLLEFGADKDLSDNDGRTALHFCALGYNTNVAEALLEDGVNPNVADLEGCTPLITAASRGKSSIIQVLLNNQKTDINTQDKDKNTALHRAVLASWHWSVRLLLMAKANPALVNSTDYVPLHIACLKGFTPGVEELLKHFPDQVNIKNSTHKTPLYLATLNGHTDIVNFLLSQKGCDVNIRSVEGHTPLHAAMVCGAPKSVEKLVTHGAEVNAKDNDGDTPLHLLRLVRCSQDISEDDDLPELLKVKEMLSCYDGLTPQTLLACFLVHKGADIYIKNSRGITTLQELPIEVAAVVASFAEKQSKCCDGDVKYSSLNEDSSGAAPSNGCVETTDSPEVSVCILCDEPVTVKLIPCGHSEICKLCVRRASKCPSCKVRIAEVKVIDNTKY